MSKFHFTSPSTVPRSLLLVKDGLDDLDDVDDTGNADHGDDPD